MALRLVSGSAGVCALYLALAPLLSGIPSARPLWMHVLLWTSAVCLLGAASLHAKLSILFARLGSALVFLAFAGSWLAYTLARMGYLQVHVRLIAVRENWFEHWRLLLDVPLRALLLVLSVACFVLALRRRHDSGPADTPVNVGPEPQSRV